MFCQACEKDRLIAFSCKGRGFCPSCCGCRMAETAAHLVDAVFPEVPVRQWVLSLPYRIRFLFGYEPELLTHVRRMRLARGARDRLLDRRAGQRQRRGPVAQHHDSARPRRRVLLRPRAVPRRGGQPGQMGHDLVEQWYIGTLKGPAANTLYKTTATSQSPTGSLRAGYGTHVRLDR